jgi:pyrroloquinoline quinone biosynthesis protein B
MIHMESAWAVVLGAAQDGGLPQMGCVCAHCREARRDLAMAEDPSSIALVDDRTRQFWLLDLSPALARQYDWLQGELGSGYRFAGAVLTHAHMGHYAGLLSLGREAMNTRAIPVWGSRRMIDFLAANAPFSQLISLGNIEPVVLAPGMPHPLGAGMHIELLPVPHREEFSDTMAVVVQGPRRRLLYCPDTDGWADWHPPIREVVATVDVAYLDATFFDRQELPGRDRREIPHPTVEETLAALGPYEAGLLARVRLIHLNHSNRLWSPAVRVAVEASGARVARRGQRETL